MKSVQQNLSSFFFLQANILPSHILLVDFFCLVVDVFTVVAYLSCAVPVTN